MSDKVLFIGFEDCEYCTKAERFLKTCGFDVKTWWTPRKRGVKLPQDIESWNGKYIFHMKSYCILPKKLISQASIAAINFHPSSPKYPGSGGISWALYNEEEKTGITVHFMNEKVDNGTIIEAYDVPIYPKDDVRSLIERVHFKQLEAFYDVVSKIEKLGKSFLDDKNKHSRHTWSDKVGKIKEIDQLETVSFEISKKELDKIIRATKYDNFGPKVFIHGHKFQFTGDKK